MFSRKITYTLHFDGSHTNQQADKAGAGCIIRDDQGELVAAAAFNLSKTCLPDYNVAIAEAMGLKNGLLLARQHSVTLNVVKGDNKEVIDHVNGRASRRPRPGLSAIIDDIKGMIDLRCVVVECIDRVHNKAADKLASMGSSLANESKIYFRYVWDLPPQLAELIKQEKVSSQIKARDDEEGSGMTNNIVKFGGALAAGVALLGIGYSMLSSGESSSSADDQQKMKNKGIEAQNIWNHFSNILTTSNNAPTLLKDKDCFTLQYFGSDRNQLQKARAGCIIWNNGSFVVASAHNLSHEYPNCNIAIAEAIALRSGLELAKVNNVRLNRIQGRNDEVLNRVLGREKRSPKLPELITIIRNIKDALDDQRKYLWDDDKLELVGEDSIGVARALATEGGTLHQKFKIYYTIQDLPYRVAMLVS